MKMKYVFYALLCTMFVGCRGCDPYMLNCMGCSDKEIDWYLMATDHPFALTFDWRGPEYGFEAKHFPNSNNYSYDLSSEIGFGAKYYMGLNALLLNFTLFHYGDGKDSNSSGHTAIAPFVGIEHHFQTGRSVSPYIGIGAGVSSWSFTNQSSEVGESHGIPTTQATSDVKDSYTTIVVQGMAGFDWYPIRNFGIGAEYSLGYASQSQSHTDAAGKTTDKPTASQFGINGAGNVHVLVHF
jgi:hypothetical protein